MGPIMCSLIKLQRTEQKLRSATTILKRSQRAVEHQKQNLNQLRMALTAKQEEIKLTRLQSSKFELDLKVGEEEIAKMRVALNTAKTNKEYSAILSRINTDKADRSKLEDQILALMTQIDADLSCCKEIEVEIERDEQQLGEFHQESEKKQTKIQAEIDQLTVDYREACDGVPHEERQTFARLVDKFDGEVLVEVGQSGLKKSEYSCRGCFMSIPLELVNSLMSRDKMVICSSCGRVLVLDLNPTELTA
jgi:predicted  nucleic acid-binding Zn-ribbon protein